VDWMSSIALESGAEPSELIATFCPCADIQNAIIKNILLINFMVFILDNIELNA
jgi:hypothetical protein